MFQRISLKIVSSLSHSVRASIKCKRCRFHLFDSIVSRHNKKKIPLGSARINHEMEVRNECLVVKEHNKRIHFGAISYRKFFMSAHSNGGQYGA